MSNISSSDIIATYEKVLNGEPWPKKYFTFVTTDIKITTIMTYILNKLNINSYEKAKQIMDTQFIEKYKLEEVAKNAKKIPEMLPDEYWNLAWYVFPDRAMSEDELIIKTYDDVLDGKRKNFPSKYFSNDDKSEHKAQVCFRHLCEDVLGYSKDEILKHFDTSSGIKILGQYKLRIILTVVYASLPQLLLAAYPDIHKQEALI